MLRPNGSTTRQPRPFTTTREIRQNSFKSRIPSRQHRLWGYRRLTHGHVVLGVLPTNNGPTTQWSVASIDSVRNVWYWGNRTNWKNASLCSRVCMTRANSMVAVHAMAPAVASSTIQWCRQGGRTSSHTSRLLPPGPSGRNPSSAGLWRFRSASGTADSFTTSSCPGSVWLTNTPHRAGACQGGGSSPFCVPGREQTTWGPTGTSPAARKCFPWRYGIRLVFSTLQKR